eukprot:SM000200S05840  [mRNA]  locus=s200:180768:183118:- [translate_table: standard]
MHIIRRAEITSDLLFKSGLVRGFCHLYDGQEAVALGMEAALTFDDSVITAYRDHGNFIARGGTPFELFCELMGRKPGAAGGKGGSMHMYKFANQFYGGWGIVGTPPPLGVGISLAQKILKKNKNITVAIYGDGAANQGQIYEAMNMAALWSLPVVFMVENNQYGMGTSVQRASAQTTYYDRWTYVPGLKVDGMDALAVKQAVSFAKDHVLSKGPMVLEMETYRYHGHSMSDPGSTYRERSEIQDMRHTRDPIERIKHLLVEEDLASEEELNSIAKACCKEVEDAAAKAKEAPEPGRDELWAHMFREDSGVVVVGCDRRNPETRISMP